MPDCCFACGQPLPHQRPAPAAESWDAALLTQLAADLGRESDAYRALWTLVREPAITLVAHWTAALAVEPSTFYSRWARAGLPAMRRYVASIRLIRVAQLWERPELTAYQIANELDFAAPQNLGRYVRQELDLTITQARARYTAANLVQRFRDTLVLPYLAPLRHTRLLAADLRTRRRQLEQAITETTARVADDGVAA